MKDKFHANNGRAKTVSKAELSAYLDKLAVLNQDEATGNPALATALRNLANTLTRAPQRAKDQPIDVRKYKEIDHNSVKRIISDDSVGKSELVTLAGSRFSIPRSRLNKLRRSEVQQAIEDALAHEESLELISSEAQRDGRNRTN